MNTNIIINLRFAATHKWPDIPSIESQFYLKYLHRHVFHIQMKWDVYHDNRAIEFVDMKNKVERYLKETYGGGNDTPSIGGMSCEMLCKDLMITFMANYVCVMEDGENGAEVFA